MNYCCGRCGALVRAQDLESDTDPKTNKPTWVCPSCKKNLKELRDKVEEAEA